MQYVMSLMSFSNFISSRDVSTNKMSYMHGVDNDCNKVECLGSTNTDTKIALLTTIVFYLTIQPFFYEMIKILVPSLLSNENISLLKNKKNTKIDSKDTIFGNPENN